MKASEVVEFLGRHPDWEVLIWAKGPKGELCLCPISKLDWDCFWPGGPSVFDLEIDMSLEATERVSLWLDNEGPLEPSVKTSERERLVHEDPALVEPIREGIAEADRGETVDLGSFAQHLDEGGGDG